MALNLKYLREMSNRVASSAYLSLHRSQTGRTNDFCSGDKSGKCFPYRLQDTSYFSRVLIVFPALDEMGQYPPAEFNLAPAKLSGFERDSSHSGSGGNVYEASFSVERRI